MANFFGDRTRGDFSKNNDLGLGLQLSSMHQFRKTANIYFWGRASVSVNSEKSAQYERRKEKDPVTGAITIVRVLTDPGRNLSLIHLNTGVDVNFQILRHLQAGVSWQYDKLHGSLKEPLAGPGADVAREKPIRTSGHQLTVKAAYSAF